MKLEVGAFKSSSIVTENERCEYQDIIDMMEGKFGYILAAEAKSMLSYQTSVGHRPCICATCRRHEL